MRLLTSALAVPALLVLLPACGNESAEQVSEPGPGPVQETTAADCASLVPDSIAEQLGWTPTGSPTQDSNTCVLDADGGSISVARRAVAAVGGDDLPDAAQAAYDERCAELDESPDPDDAGAEPAAGQTTTWIAGVESCAVLARPDQLGTSILLVLTDDDAVVEVRVDADEVPEESQQQAVLTELGEIAVEQL